MVDQVENTQSSGEPHAAQLSEQTAKEPAYLAGFVLAVIGVFALGSTSPYAAILCLEWLRNPNRRPNLRTLDWVGLGLAVPGTLYMVWATPTIWENRIEFGPGTVFLYWGVFLAWTAYRWLWLKALHPGFAPQPRRA